MAQDVIPDVGGVWVLVERGASACAIPNAMTNEATTPQRVEEGRMGKGPLLLFLAAIGIEALHLNSGA
ncbi:MAG: hypothetical protein WCR85_00190 [Sphaerochaeta sp.]